MVGEEVKDYMKLSNESNQQSSKVVLTTALYTSSFENLETDYYLLEDQEKKLLPINTIVDVYQPYC